MLNIELLSTGDEERYDNFLAKSPDTLLYASSLYRRLLLATLDAQDRYLIAVDSQKNIVGALPTFICHGPAGTILNSLPFYGSNGDIIEHRGNPSVRTLLVSAFESLVRQECCVASTLVTSPLQQQGHHWASADYIGRRIGQLTPLPAPDGDLRESSNKLFAQYHYKTRNMVRKAEKSGVTIERSETSTSMDFLYKTHVANICAIGGIYKPRRFFDAIAAHCIPGKDYRIYLASVDGAPVAALLLLCYNRTVEYFTPVVIEEFRAHQPLSLAIHHAMVEAVKDRFMWWNWGGTWLNQDGVYRFKSRWGTQDRNYFYYTRIYDRTILNLTKEKLLQGYPNFYVVPFDTLTTGVAS